MSEEPRVTVLLAVHDGGDYLREAIESVLAQTLRDFELLIVDDASADGSAELAESFGDPRVRVLRNERNLGQIPSLNRGLREARGAYVARLDHDDLCLPRRLESQAALLDRLPDVALVGSWLDIVESDGLVWARVRGRIDSFADLIACLLVDDVPLAHPSLMFRRDPVLAVGGFDESLGAAEDKDLYRKLALERREIRIVPEVLVRYRRHEGQMTYTKAAMVRGNDARSQERFLAALAPDRPAAALASLLSGQPRFWHGPHLGAAELERLLDSIGERLALGPTDRARVAAACAGGVARTILAGWGERAPAYATRSADLARFAARHGRARERAVAALQPLLVASAPLGAAAAPARDALKRTVRLRRLEPLRRRARRSATLRRLYTRLVGPRLLDDRATTSVVQGRRGRR